jgi:hypothetical protein
VLAGAVIGVVMSVTMPRFALVPEGEEAAGAGPGLRDVRELFARIDEGLALLEAGLPL